MSQAASIKGVLKILWIGAGEAKGYARGKEVVSSKLRPREEIVQEVKKDLESSELIKPTKQYDQARRWNFLHAIAVLSEDESVDFGNLTKHLIWNQDFLDNLYVLLNQRDYTGRIPESIPKDSAKFKLLSETLQKKVPLLPTQELQAKLVDDIKQERRVDDLYCKNRKWNCWHLIAMSEKPEFFLDYAKELFSSDVKKLLEAKDFQADTPRIAAAKRQNVEVFVKLINCVMTQEYRNDLDELALKDSKEISSKKFRNSWNAWHVIASSRKPAEFFDEIVGWFKCQEEDYALFQQESNRLLKQADEKGRVPSVVAKEFGDYDKFDALMKKLVEEEFFKPKASKQVKFLGLEAESEAGSESKKNAGGSTSKSKDCVSLIDHLKISKSKDSGFAFSFIDLKNLIELKKVVDQMKMDQFLH